MFQQDCLGAICGGRVFWYEDVPLLNGFALPISTAIKTMKNALRCGVFLLMISPFLGCGGGSDHGVQLHSVTGVVLQGGQAVEGAVVALYRKDDLGSGIPVPKGVTNAAGAFAIRTFEPGDGAPVGEYAVTVRFAEEVETPDGQIVERDRFEGAYANPNKPVATVEVTSGSNRVPDIELN